MSAIIPITLVGENLGKRHLYLNSLVDEIFKQNEDFNVIKDLLEQSPIDRFFKIDLASKIRNVDYIIENLKDDDLLYVSKALKSKWLIEKEEIINPQYLELELYPKMITTAVTKMKHWTYINLKDEKRCQQFYEYYYDTHFDFAIKFLFKCSKDVIRNEFLKVVRKVTPHYFKIICEKCPELAKVFFDLLSENEEVKCQYLDKEIEYFNTLRHLVKTNTDIVLDICERYFNKDQFKSFSPDATKFILLHHKKRFIEKPELYTAYLLDLKTLAESLSSEEAKDLVIKLARAKYLTYLHWFCYKTVEPLIKRLKPDERPEFKKKVFVKNDVGETTEEWSYEPPAPPNRECSDYITVFDDRQPEPYEYECLKTVQCTKRRIKKKRGDKCEMTEICCSNYTQEKSLLDKLFDEFRFVSFGQTLYDLRNRIAAESSPQNREFMMLVLVSKSGGRPDAIALLLELLARHSNEPCHVRAAIIRSLAKRAFVWRLPEESWNQLLEFGRGLGLDGTPPEADCNEGLHAVVIRSFLLTGELESSIQNAFLRNFSDFTEYSLTAGEKKCIRECLPKMLLSATKEKDNIAEASNLMNVLVDTLNVYRINLETYPGLIDTIEEFAEKDISEMTYLLIKLFDARVARKQLFRHTFDILKTDASYVNALKHDISVLDEKKFTQYYVENFMTFTEKFITKLSIYFNEENGLSSKFLNELKSNIPLQKLGRPLAILMGGQLESYLSELDALNDTNSKLLAASIRANAHVTRPFIDIGAFGWHKAGAKFIANKLLKCRAVEIDNNIKELLKNKRTARLALTLSRRTTYETEVFVKLAKIRPLIAIKSGIKLLKLHGNETDLQIWDTMKPIIEQLDIIKAEENKRLHLLKNLSNIKKIPSKIRPEYSTVFYTLFKKKSIYKAMPPLCHAEILLEDVKEDFVENLLLLFLKDNFTTDMLSKDFRDIKCTCLYIRILVKFIFLSKSEEIQKKRFETFGVPFLAQMEELHKLPEHKEAFDQFFNEMLLTFKYSKVFLNPQYVSPLPVMEKAVIWMQKILPMEEHFKTYVKLHLTMLFCKAVRQSVKSVPEVFSDELKTRKEGVKIVANLFGKYIAREVSSLTKKYFDSITELYKAGLDDYIEKYNYYYVSSDFLSSLIKGVLEESKGPEYRIGIHLISEKYGYLREEHYKEVKEYVRGITDSEAQWFAFAEIFA